MLNPKRHKARIYLDVSCLNRPFDDQGQARIRVEAEAVAVIFEGIEFGRWEQVASEMVHIEVEATRDEERMRRVNALLSGPEDTQPLTVEVYCRAEILEGLGFKAADAVHIAAAESAAADVLLTCDDRMLSRARRLKRQLGVRVENPVDWIREQKDEDDS